MESKLVFLLSFLLLLFVFSCGLAAWSTILDAPDRFDEKIGFIGYGLMVMTAAVSMIGHYFGRAGLYLYLEPLMCIS
jgi:predicted membrane metal-binding protein